MGERRGETDHFRLLVDRCRLDGRDLVAAKHLAYDIEAARERGIAKRLISFAEGSMRERSQPAISQDW
jgi:hypothetical protein